MSTTSQVYSDFRAISELLTKLNHALITAKRVVFKTQPKPGQAEIQEATNALLNFLIQQSSRSDGRAREAIHSPRPGPRRQLAVPINVEDAQRCIGQLRSGLGTLDQRSLDFIEGVVRQLGQSSEGLYRQMARL
jgi:hypothetical protein